MCETHLNNPQRLIKWINIEDSFNALDFSPSISLEMLILIKQAFIKIWNLLVLSFLQLQLHQMHSWCVLTGISTSSWLGLSSHLADLGLSQQIEGVRGKSAPLFLGYLQSGDVTMTPTAGNTISSWCLVGFIKVGLVILAYLFVGQFISID